MDATPLAAAPTLAGDGRGPLARWREIPALFLDSPAGAVREADDLTTELLLGLGASTECFEERVAWVEHLSAQAANHYRRAHAVRLAMREQRVDTEDLRVALVNYRSVLESILELSGGGTGHETTLPVPRSPSSEAPVARRAS